MQTSILDEFSTFGGSDETATVAWLKVYFEDDKIFHRVDAHWREADQQLQDAIGSFLGLSYPMEERCPMPKCIQDDYKSLFDRVYAILSDEEI